MQDYFAQCNPLEDSKAITPVEGSHFMGNEHSVDNSMEDQLKIIRSAGKSFLRKSTQGFLLLKNTVAKRKQQPRISVRV